MKKHVSSHNSARFCPLGLRFCMHLGPSKIKILTKYGAMGSLNKGLNEEINFQTNLATNLKNNSGLEEHLLPGLEPLGVPKGLKGSVIPFKFNNWDDLDNVVRKKAKSCAAIILEPCRESYADKKFIIELRKIANKKLSIAT